MSRRFDIHWRDESGLTLAELTVVLSLMTALLGVMFLTLQVANRIADSASARSIASDEVRVVNRKLVQELRQAQELDDGLGAFQAIEPRRVVFYADIDHDGAPERVTYYVDGRLLKRTVAEPASTPVGPTTGWGSDSAPMTLLTNLSPTFTGSVFTYKTAGSGSTTVTASSQIPNVALVGVHIVNAAHSGEVTSTVDEDAWVKIRVISSEIN